MIFPGTYTAPVNFNVPLQQIEIAGDGVNSNVYLDGAVTVSTPTIMIEENAEGDTDPLPGDLTFGSTLDDSVGGTNLLTIENQAAAHETAITTTAGAAPVSQ